MSGIPSNAPGCFGSALAYQAQHAFCQACIFKAECEPLHVANLETLRAKLGVTSVGQKHKSLVTSAPQVPTLPKKTQELVDRLDRANLNVVANLQAKKNPFDDKFPVMKVAAHILLHFPRPVPPNVLCAAFMKQFKWGDDYAAAHARMTVQALKHIGAVEEIDNAIRVKGAA